LASLYQNQFMNQNSMCKKGTLRIWHLYLICLLFYAFFVQCVLFGILCSKIGLAKAVSHLNNALIAYFLTNKIKLKPVVSTVAMFHSVLHSKYDWWNDGKT